MNNRETIFLREGKDYEKNPHFFRTVGDDKFQLYGVTTSEPTLKVNGEPFVMKANKSGEGFNTKIGNKRVFLNFGENDYGRYAKVDLIDEDSTIVEKEVVASSSSRSAAPFDSGVPKKTSYNKKPAGGRFGK